jgi:hypothetical protein
MRGGIEKRMNYLPVLLLCFLLFLPFETAGNEPASTQQSPAVIARISLILPKLVVDFAPTGSFSFTTGVMFRPTFGQEGPDGETFYRPGPRLNPKFYMEPRYFFNQAHREKKGKRRDYHSGWYVGLPFILGLPGHKFTMGTVMGFQCTFGARWYWNWEVGPGLYYQEGAFSVRPYADVAFGIILN